MSTHAFTEKSLSSWSNTDNQALYENLPLEEFYKISVIGGLDSGKDIDIIMPYASNAETILELGAGYGRVLNHLLIRGYTGKLTAIERCNKLCQWLHSQYAKRVTVLQGSILTVLGQEKYDLILWMWAGLAEFSLHEQATALEKLAKHLTPHGKIILDMVPHNKVALNAVELQPQEQIIETNYGVDHCYVPSEEQIYTYAKQANLHLTEKIPYKTLPNRTRWLYVLSK